MSIQKYFDLPVNVEAKYSFNISTLNLFSPPNIHHLIANNERLLFNLSPGTFPHHHYNPDSASLILSFSATGRPDHTHVVRSNHAMPMPITTFHPSAHQHPAIHDVS